MAGGGRACVDLSRRRLLRRAVGDGAERGGDGGDPLRLLATALECVGDGRGADPSAVLRGAELAGAATRAGAAGDDAMVRGAVRGAHARARAAVCAASADDAL